jgi:hypothetical protein
MKACHMSTPTGKTIDPISHAPGTAKAVGWWIDSIGEITGSVREGVGGRAQLCLEAGGSPDLGVGDDDVLLGHDDEEDVPIAIVAVIAPRCSWTARPVKTWRVSRGESRMPATASTIPSSGRWRSGEWQTAT